MPTTIETVFEKGVFRPLKPVAIAENRRIRIRFDDTETNDRAASTHPRLLPGEYPTDGLDESAEDSGYLSVPPKSILSIPARFHFAGKHQPATFSDE